MQNTASPIEGLPLDSYIRQAQLIPNILPISSPTLWRMVKAGTFPKPVKLGPRMTAWKVEDVRAWVQARATSSASAGE